MPLDALIKFRCEQSLADRLEAIANHPKVRRDVPDLLRLALTDYAFQQEELLGISGVAAGLVEDLRSGRINLEQFHAARANDAPPTAEQLAAQAMAHARDTAGDPPVSYAPAAKRRAKKPQSP